MDIIVKQKKKTFGELEPFDVFLREDRNKICLKVPENGGYNVLDLTNKSWNHFVDEKEITHFKYATLELSE